MTEHTQDTPVSSRRSGDRAKGPWHHRVLIWFFSVLLAVLVYWMLGFVVNDIGSLPGPGFPVIERSFVSSELVSEATALTTSIEEVARTIGSEERRQAVLRDGTDNAARTMDQLLEIQRLNSERGIAPAETERTALAEAQRLFLDNQRRYQQSNEEVARLTDQLRTFEQRQREVRAQIDAQRAPAMEEYRRLNQRHQLKIAALKLSLLVPLLALAVILFLRYRQGLYAPVTYAVGAATLLKVVLVMHEHFPRRYFKYVLIVAALVLVLRVLIYLVRASAFPRRETLLRQYREAYEHFFCPVCNFPIRKGPLRYAYWTRRSLKRVPIPTDSAANEDRPYTCPACGTQLFESCPSCGGVRHSLLPACARCGVVKVAP
jgi:hypothetical protein